MKRTALIIGNEPRILIPVARSLNRLGIPVVTLGHSEARLPRSRAVSQYLTLPNGPVSPEQEGSFLERVLESQAVEWVVAGSDTALSLVVRHHKLLTTRARLGCPEPEAIEAVLDKEQTLATARRCGIPVPRTHRCPSVETLRRLSVEMKFPLIAKPHSKQVDAAFKLRFYSEPAQIEAEYAEDPEFGRKYLLQEYASGEGVGIEVLLRAGEPELLFQHRRLKEHPSMGGVSVLAESEALNRHLADMSVALLRALRWEGVAMVEYRVDGPSGQVALMEVNGRYWGSLALSTHAGLDFPAAHWQLAHGGRRSAPPPYRTGVQARWTEGQLLRLEDLAERRSMNWPGSTLGQELRTVWKDFRPGIVDMLWDPRDPWPSLASLSLVIRQIATRRIRQAAVSFLPKALLSAVRTYRRLPAPAGRLFLARQWRAYWTSPRRLPRPLRSVLFVCHGNIIRSAMAEAQFRKLSALDAHSAGVHATAGHPADERGRRIAAEFGVRLDGHTARPVARELVDGADAIFVMDVLNEVTLVSEFPHVSSKVFRLGAFSPRPLPGRDIPDPFLGTEDEIRACYQTLATCVRRLVLELEGRPA